MTIKMHFGSLVPAGLMMLTYTATGSIYAADSASLELGSGNLTHIARLGLQSQWQKRWFQSNGTHLGGYWDVTLARWRAAKHQGADNAGQTIWDLGITPVLRFQPDTGKGPYAEAGIGAHLLSDLYDNDGRRFSTRFQFGDHIGFGYVFQSGLDLSLKIQHFSNCSIKQPNPGTLFTALKVAYSF
ncbi:MAG: acyloxyacyl hydrolase [Pseudomonadota bacterium]